MTPDQRSDSPTRARAAVDRGPCSDGRREPVESGEALDRIVQLAPPWTVFALVACAALVIGIVVWGLNGTVSSTVTSPGFLDDVGASTVRATAPGQVDQVPVQVGQSVTRGETVATLRDGSTLTAPVTGQVVSVTVSPGSTLVTGQSVVIVADLTIDPLVVTKVAPSYIGTIRVGMPVRMEVEGAPPTRYGYLVGTVSDITNNPYSNAEIAARLSLDEQFVETELGSNPGLLAVIRLQPDRSTPTGFAWTIGEGPTLVAQQGTPITVHTVLEETTPFGMVFPQLARS